MKRLALLAVLPLLLAADKPWPQKGDTVYVSANLTAISGLFVLTGGPPSQTPVAACWPVTVTKIRTSAPYWLLAPERGLIAEALGANWPARFHRSVEECKSAFAENGQPEMISVDGAQKIRSQE